MAIIWDRKQVDLDTCLEDLQNFFRLSSVFKCRFLAYFQLNHVFFEKSKIFDFLTFKIKTFSTLFCPKSQFLVPKIANNFVIYHIGWIYLRNYFGWLFWVILFFIVQFISCVLIWAFTYCNVGTPPSAVIWERFIQTCSWFASDLLAFGKEII